MKILLVEDDEILADALVTTLTEQRYVVDVATDGQLGWDYALDGNYDLILMDVGLPKLDGISLCQRLRAENYASPILLMTAKDASSERIRGLDAGADDYVTKPLDLGELHARVRALLRRSDVLRSPILHVGDLRLDPATCQVTFADQPLGLTPKEYSLLELLMRHPTRVFSRGQMIEHLWTYDDPPQEESVKAHIKGLRQKLKAVGAADWIENVYGIGYRLNPPLLTSQAATAATDAATPPRAPTVEQQFNQAVDALWQRYEGLMIERLMVLNQAAIAITQANLSADLQQAAAQAAHKLAGVLGMFDRDEGTQLARQIERGLESENLQSLATVPDLIQHLSQLLNLSEQPVTEPTANLLIHPDRHLGRSLQHPAELEDDRGEPDNMAHPERSQTVHVLVVDDDPLFVVGLRSLLDPWGIRVSGLTDPLRFWDVLPSTAPDLVILDVQMPQLSGIDLCQAVRTDPTWNGLPILFLTAHRDTETVQQGFAAGADDFIVKPVIGPELVTRITHRLERTRLLQTLSTKDPVTGLANQHQSSQALMALLHASSEAAPVYIALIAATELHEINCQYGHGVGNQVLARWGQLFQTVFRGTERLGYWGYGEFVVGLPHLNHAAAHDRLTELLAILRKQVYSAPDGTRFQVNGTGAIAAYPTEGASLQALYQILRQQIDAHS